MAGTDLTPLPPPWRALPDGVSLAVKAQPGARRAGVQGLAPDVDGQRLRVAVAEPAEDGRANRAVCEAVARALGIKPAAVCLRQGAATRQKTLHISGDAAALIARLEGLIAPP